MASTLTRIGAWMARVSAVSGLVSATGLAWVFTRFGPELAMGLAIYGGNTEPARPSAELPLAGLVFTLGVAVALLVASAKWPQAAWGALAVSLVGLAVDVAYLLTLLEGT